MDQFERCVRAMLDARVAEADVETMIKDNPRRIFDLD
jgi:predicted metal-dependent phosphotriesterase family hydrolase